MSNENNLRGGLVLNVNVGRERQALGSATNRFRGAVSAPAVKSAFASVPPRAKTSKTPDSDPVCEEAGFPATVQTRQVVMVADQPTDEGRYSLATHIQKIRTCRDSEAELESLKTEILSNQTQTLKVLNQGAIGLSRGSSHAEQQTMYVFIKVAEAFIGASRIEHFALRADTPVSCLSDSSEETSLAASLSARDGDFLSRLDADLDLYEFELSENLERLRAYNGVLRAIIEFQADSTSEWLEKVSSDLLSLQGATPVDPGIEELESPRPELKQLGLLTVLDDLKDLASQIDQLNFDCGNLQCEINELSAASFERACLLTNRVCDIIGDEFGGDVTTENICKMMGVAIDFPDGFSSLDEAVLYDVDGTLHYVERTIQDLKVDNTLGDELNELYSDLSSESIYLIEVKKELQEELSTLETRDTRISKAHSLLGDAIDQDLITEGLSRMFLARAFRVVAGL